MIFPGTSSLLWCTQKPGCRGPRLRSHWGGQCFSQSSWEHLKHPGPHAWPAAWEPPRKLLTEASGPSDGASLETTACRPSLLEMQTSDQWHQQPPKGLLEIQSALP